MRLGCTGFLVAIAIASQTATAADKSTVCSQLEDAEDDGVTISVKYTGREARNAAWSIAAQGMQLDFISRLVIDTNADKVLQLCQRDDIADIEVIGTTEKDTTLYRLLEVWRVYHYVIGGRFNVSAFNFSQGVRPVALHRGISAERTMAEALDTLARKAAPVFVAAGNSGEAGVSDYIDSESVLPVAATLEHGNAIFAPSSRPAATDHPRLFLFADGGPRPRSEVDQTDNTCPKSEHLTVGQMMAPDEAGIDPGGSSFATFAASAAACPVHQYLQIVDAYLSATRAVGEVQVEPFIAYYVDNPITASCSALKNRLADKRSKYDVKYNISVPEKIRFQDFFFGNSVEFNLSYSTPLLRSFFRSMPEQHLVEGYQGPQRYVSTSAVLAHLRGMTFADWLNIAANKNSLYFPGWMAAAQKDSAPLLDSETIDAIGAYCRNYSLFIVLPQLGPSHF